jgi:hypothetical protein
VVKLLSKINKICAYSVLFAYLSILVINIYHYHNISINGSDLSFNSQSEKKFTHLYLDGSEIICPTLSAFNAIHNFVLLDENKLKFLSDFSVPIIIDKNYSVPANPVFYHYSLRAPPSFSSRS